MSAAGTAHQKIVTLLGNFSPSPLWDAVYDTHEKANLVVPSLSVEVETDTPLVDDNAITAQELVDNRNVQITVRVHTSYRLGPVDTNSATDIADAAVRWLRENIDLGDGYRLFETTGTAYNVEHTSSGTAGAEITINIHKVEYYEQS